MSEDNGFESVEMAGCDPPQSDRPTAIDMGEEVQSNRSVEVQNSDTAEDKEDDFSWEIKLKSIRYYRSSSSIEAKEILKLFKNWEMILPHVFFSVLSDSEFDSDTGVEQEAIQSNPKESVPAIRKTFCRSLVEAVAATEAWLITGGLNKGVDQLIGNEVKERLANWNKIPNVVIGITNRECIARQKNQLNDSHIPNGEESDIIPTGLSLNQHHTHCLILDDATQRESGLECSLRQNVEMALTEWQTKKTETSVIRAQLIYILIGGRINALHVVKRAMDKSLPVIIAVGTGGVADIISEAVSYKDGSILEYLPEIAEELFTHLGKLLVAEGFHANLARQIIADIKAESKLLFEIFDLLSQARRTYNVGARQFYEEISTLKKATTYELLVGIRDLLITKQTPLNSSRQSDDIADSDTVNRMRVVFEHMLFVNGIPQEKAEHAVELLESTLTRIKVVFDDLKAIRTHDQKDLLIKYDISSTEKKTMPSLLVETLKKAKWEREKDLYMLFANWDNETFFRQLLLDNWMRLHHESVFTELLKKGKTKYVRLMMEYISNRTWLTKAEGPLLRNHENVFTELRKKRKRKDAKFMLEHISDNKWCTDLSGPLEKGFKKNRMCFKLLKKIEAGNNEVDRFRMKGKMLFIWFVLKGMHETAMLFWEQGQDCLAMALVAYDLSKKQQKDLKKRHDEMELQLKFFADLALDFLNKCLADNQQYTIGMLFKELEDLDNIVPYEIAMNANFEAFFCVDTIQDLVNEIWTTGIRNHDKCRYIPMILSLGCPLLAPALLDISSDDDDDNEDNRNKQSKCQRVCNYFWKVLHFLDTPLVKFTYRFVSCIAHLTIFSIVMLTNFRTTISPLEIVLIVWTISLIVEEGKQIAYDISGYISNGWNYLDLGALTMYIIGFILRVIYHSDPTRCPDCLYVARIILAFSLILFFLRALEFLAIIDATGPKIYMMRHLVADLVSILLIFAVFISAYGVVSNVILYPNQPLNVHLLRDVFHDAFWSVMQQFNLDGPAGSNCKNDNASSIFTKEYCSNMSDNNIDYQGCKTNGCPANTWIVSVLLAVYAIVTGIMLLNVLIAMFNDTFSKINEYQKDVSKLQQHRLMHEYGDVSMVPSPLCVLLYIIVIFLIGCVGCVGCVACVVYLIIRRDDDSEEGSSSSTQPACSSEAYEPSEKERWQKWELDLAAELCRENKDKEGWPAVRMTFETSNKFDENRWTNHIIQEIRNQMKTKQDSREQLEKTQMKKKQMKKKTYKSPAEQARRQEQQALDQRMRLVQQKRK